MLKKSLCSSIWRDQGYGTYQALLIQRVHKKLGQQCRSVFRQNFSCIRRQITFLRTAQTSLFNDLQVEKRFATHRLHSTESKMRSSLKSIVYLSLYP